MTHRKVHRVGTMIACNTGKLAYLVSERDFAALAESLMEELSTLDRVAFKSAVARNLGLMNAEENIGKWEATFLKRFIGAVESRQFVPVYDFLGEDAQYHLDDFLEAYRYSYQRIGFGVGTLHNGQDEIVNISLRHKRTVTERALGRPGKIYAELNILKSDVSRLKGSSIDFQVHTASRIYHFEERGVV